MERYPLTDFHLVDPRSIWRVWTFLQRYADVNIRWNPPSSGFIGKIHISTVQTIQLIFIYTPLGLALILPVCTYVDIIEYIPSTRLNGRCHYYDEEV